MFRPRIILALAAAAVVTGAVGAVAVRAGTSVSPACQKATQWVARDQMLIKRLNNQRDNITNSQTVVNPVRKRQIAVQLARLRADLVRAQAAKKQACLNEPKVWTLADYDGVYTASFTGVPRLTIGFTVDNGNVTGDLTSTVPLNPATGNVPVTASFAGASCGAATLHIDPATGAANTGQVTCTLGGQSATGQIQAQRK